MENRMIYIASDHKGVRLKASLSKWLQEGGFEVRDLGPETEERCNASDYAIKVAKALQGDKGARGLLICGTGQAMTMTANRYQHVRAALCLNGFMARLAREHNDANVLTLGSELIGEGMALDVARIFFKTEALGGRYAERVQFLTNLGGL